MNLLFCWSKGHDCLYPLLAKPLLHSAVNSKLLIFMTSVFKKCGYDLFCCCIWAFPFGNYLTGIADYILKTFANFVCPRHFWTESSCKASVHPCATFYWVTYSPSLSWGDSMCRLPAKTGSRRWIREGCGSCRSEWKDDEAGGVGVTPRSTYIPWMDFKRAVCHEKERERETLETWHLLSSSPLTAQKKTQSH